MKKFAALIACIAAFAVVSVLFIQSQDPSLANIKTSMTRQIVPSLNQAQRQTITSVPLGFDGNPYAYSYSRQSSSSFPSSLASSGLSSSGSSSSFSSSSHSSSSGGSAFYGSRQAAGNNVPLGFDGRPVIYGSAGNIVRTDLGEDAWNITIPYRGGVGHYRPVVEGVLGAFRDEVKRPSLHTTSGTNRVEQIRHETVVNVAPIHGYAYGYVYQPFTMIPGYEYNEEMLEEHWAYYLNQLYVQNGYRFPNNWHNYFQNINFPWAYNQDINSVWPQFVQNHQVNACPYRTPQNNFIGAHGHRLLRKNNKIIMEHGEGCPMREAFMKQNH